MEEEVLFKCNYLDSRLINVSRGLCPCGKTNFNVYGLCDMLRGKSNPDICKKCGVENPINTYDEDEE